MNVKDATQLLVHMTAEMRPKRIEFDYLPRNSKEAMDNDFFDSHLDSPSSDAGKKRGCPLTPRGHFSVPDCRYNLDGVHNWSPLCGML